MPLWLPWLGKGLVLGLAGGGINHYLLTQALKKVKDEKFAQTADKIITKCYAKRFVVIIITLLSAYFLFSADMVALIGTALGLTLPKYFLNLLKLD
ncbi:MAG: hypothetical protein GX092_00205 [Clostridia bacterium]|jgi:hypothetical protein|nr:hypothetical protein [Clostridia bacterium]